MADEPLIAENGNEITLEEYRAITALHRLARRWPQTLKLVSMSGALHVIHTDDQRFHDPDSPSRRGETVLDSISGIPNDGGDW